MFVETIKLKHKKSGAVVIFNKADVEANKLPDGFGEVSQYDGYTDEVPQASLPGGGETVAEGETVEEPGSKRGKRKKE